MQDLLQYIGKEITVSYRGDDDSVETITGKVEKANAACMIVRPKGKAFVLIDVDDVASVEVMPDPVTAIKIRSMEKILPENIRQHMADRHGTPLEFIPDGDEDARVMHEAMHTRSLGHHHRPSADEVAGRIEVLEAAATISDDDGSEEE